MLKNITLSAEESLIKKARQKAGTQNKSLNEMFRVWLSEYVQPNHKDFNMEAFMKRFDHIDSGGRKYTREEMNERR